MTYGEMDDAFKRLLDEAQAPAAEPQERMDYLNAACLVWVLNHSPEISEKARIDLSPITRVETYNTLSVVDKDDLGFAYLRLIGLYGKWTNCGNEFVRIEPLIWDSYGNAQRDPYQQPTDCFPMYTEDDYKLTVLSDTTASQVKITYLKKPNTIDPVSNDGVTSQFKDHACMEIVELALNRYLEVIESPRLNTQTQFIQPLQ